MVTREPTGQGRADRKKGCSDDDSFYWRKRGKVGICRNQAVPPAGLYGQETCVTHCHVC